MADKKTAGSSAKRRVKNPETFRERALKANAESEKKPKRQKQAAKAGGKVASGLSRPFKRLARTAPFRLIGKIIFPAYLRNSWRELKLVTWPSWKESQRLTFAVIIFAVVFGAVIAIVDYGLDKIFRNILLK